ncbi:HAUS augmin-like complex subunit 7 [Trichosurus vulpecula]|uniref:HAUS augmin-like complex subunit 7 n=1 Tax=Trichosurus vulpecula TaxID=9337 RepID=UPI00186B0AD6|nr:HAUS augmin-like complex subunit 7 [Trichosurus vulpecula]
MAQRWSGFGNSGRDQEVARARNRRWEEFWGAEENDWAEEEDEDEEEEEEEVREFEDEEQEEREEDDEDVEWENVMEGNWVIEEEEEDWEEEEEEEQVNVEEKAEGKEDEEDAEEEDCHLSLEALRVLDKLKAMNCPFLNGLYKSKLKTAKQFLCTPSIYRLDILAWLITRLYPPFRESFDTWQDSNPEEKIIELTRLGHELMLCGPNDQDLIKGCASEKQQLGFMNELINLIEVLSSEINDSLTSSENLNIRELMEKKKIMPTKFFNPDLSQETTDPKPNPSSAAAAMPGCEKNGNLCEKPLKAKMKVEELSEKLTKLTEILQAHEEEVRNRQSSANKPFLLSPTGRPVRNKKTVNEAKSVKAERKKAYLGGANSPMTVGMQSLPPKPVTNPTTPTGIPSVESELGDSP